MPASALPSGWVSTGEHLGAAAGSDGTVDGKLGIGTFSANITDANFGIRFVNPLPVTLMSFNAVAEGEDIFLKWVTFSEINCSSYDVQHSTEGRSWTGIGNIAATGNGSSLATSYYFTHKKPAPGKNFYRLQLNDIDGRTGYSKVVTIIAGNTNIAPVMLYPNPVTNGKVTLWSGIEIKEMIITDVAGKVVMKIVLDGAASGIDVSALASGYYVCTVIDKNDRIAGRVSLVVSK